MNTITTKKWYAIYTNARAEKRVCKLLEDTGIEVFLPLQKVLKQWSDRKKIVEVPLFNSYVFVHVDLLNYQTVLQTPGVVKYISFEGKAVPIPQEQIRNLQLLVNNNAELEVSSRKFKAGEKIEIKIGSLKGLIGELVRVGTKNRVLVRIEHFEQNLLVNIPANYLV